MLLFDSGPRTPSGHAGYLVNRPAAAREGMSAADFVNRELERAAEFWRLTNLIKCQTGR